MLTWLLAMSASVSVAGEAPRVVTLPKRARPAATARKRPVRKAQRRIAARPIKLCLTGTCAPAVTSRYRLADTNAPTWSAKMDVVKSGGVPCGVQGAPVCPSKGRELVRTSVD
ncbi:hypothetical protein [Sphingomonas sp. LT1P40]|uniref:hypothetical protein n=1 Tax=Alteristakelama amylovorans TaxID=3096166 RepID=UPI002FC87C43